MEIFKIPNTEVLNININGEYKEVELKFFYSRVTKGTINYNNSDENKTVVEENPNSKIQVTNIDIKGSNNKLVIRLNEINLKKLNLTCPNSTVIIKNADFVITNSQITTKAINIEKARFKNLELKEANTNNTGEFQITNSIIKNLSFKNNNIYMNNSICDSIIQEEDVITPPIVTIYNSKVNEKKFTKTKELNITQL